MKDDLSFADALEFARHHARKGLQTYPFDALYRTTIDKIALIERDLAYGVTLADLPTDPDLGAMAAKELGNDKAAFAHALSVMQSDIEQAQQLVADTQ